MDELTKLLENLPRFDAVQGGKVVYMRNGKRMERALPGFGQEEGDSLKSAAPAPMINRAAAVVAGGPVGILGYQAARYANTEHGKNRLSQISKANKTIKEAKLEMTARKKNKKELNASKNQEDYDKKYKSEHDAEEAARKQIKEARSARGKAVGEAFKGYSKKIMTWN